MARRRTTAYPNGRPRRARTPPPTAEQLAAAVAATNPPPAPEPAPPRDPRCKFDELKEGDIVSCVSYCKVVRKGFDSVELINHNGLKMAVGSGVIEDEYFAAKQHSRTEEKTATELTRILRSAGAEAFEVVFNKKPDEKTCDAKLKRAFEEDPQGTLGNPRKRRKFLREEILKGEERRMVARLVHSERSVVTYTGQGRINVIDLRTQLDGASPPAPHSERQVDPRTITEVVLRDVKYKLK